MCTEKVGLTESLTFLEECGWKLTQAYLTPALPDEEILYDLRPDVVLVSVACGIEILVR